MNPTSTWSRRPRPSTPPPRAARSARRHRRLVAAALAALAATACARWAQEPRFGSLRPEQRAFSFRHNIDLIEVSNGLRVALVHDDRTNLATVDMRFEVGAAEDPPGRAGLAHLVEHLMFEIRERGDGPTLGDELGELALHHNAWTSWDTTHYTATVPVEHLERALALEARRLRVTCDQLDEATFRRERDVVLAEDKQRATPLDETFRAILGDVYGAGHPYTRPVGSPEVATATREEACAFIERHYTPDRAKLVVTGPYDRRSIQGLLGRTFGPARRQAGAPRAPVAAARLTGTLSRRTAAVDRPQALVFLPHPPWGAEGGIKHVFGRLGLEAALDRADDDHAWITDTDVFVVGGPRARAMLAVVEVDDAARLQQAADLVFARAAALFEGTSDRALSAALGATAFEYLASWDDLAARGAWLADFMQFASHNWFMIMELRALIETDWKAAFAQLRGTLIAERSHVVLLTPGPGATGTVAAALPVASHQVTPWRRPVDPALADRPLVLDRAPAAPQVVDYELGNGLRVLLAPDPASPIVDARLIFPVGSAHEPPDRPYLATAAARLLSQDAEGYYEGEVYQRLRWATSLGTDLDARVAESSTTFTARGVAKWADWHVWYLSWRLDQGRYNQGDLDAVHRAARALDPDGDDTDPVAAAFLQRLFGKDHPYAQPAPDRKTGYLRLGARDLQRWRERHFRARGATLVVSGGFDVDRMKRVIAELYGPWSTAAPADLPPVPPTRPARGPSWLAAEDDEARQLQLTLGFAARSDHDGDHAARQVLREMVSDGLRDVREAMGASYGVQARYLNGAAGGAFLIDGKVDAALGGAALDRILTAVASIAHDGDDARAAFVRARKKVLAQAVARTGGASAVAGMLEDHAAAGRSLAAARERTARIAALTFADVRRVAAADLDEGRRVVLVRGERAAVEAAFAAVGATPEWPAPARTAAAPRPADPAATAAPAAPADDAPRAAASGAAGRGADRPTSAVDSDRPATPPRPGRRRAADAAPLRVSSDQGDGVTLHEGTRTISLDEFLAIAGRDDLRRDMRTRRWAKRGMYVTAVAGIAGGAGLALSGGNCNDLPLYSDQEVCRGRATRRKNLGTGIAGLGAVVFAIASQVGSGAPSRVELREIASRYNRVVGDAPPARPTPPTVAVTPTAGPDGAGLVVTGRF